MYKHPKYVVNTEQRRDNFMTPRSEVSNNYWRFCPVTAPALPMTESRRNDSRKYSGLFRNRPSFEAGKLKTPNFPPRLGALDAGEFAGLSLIGGDATTWSHLFDYGR